MITDYLFIQAHSLNILHKAYIIHNLTMGVHARKDIVNSVNENDTRHNSIKNDRWKTSTQK